MAKYQKKQKMQGFSLMEIVVAMAVLGIGFLGVMNLYSGSITRNASLRDQTTATSLAQEGVELVRGFADDNLTNLTHNSTGKVHIRSDNSIELAINPSDYKLYYSVSIVGSIGNFSHTAGGVDTGFWRKVYIVKTNIDGEGVGDDDARVTSMVVWKRITFPAETDCSLATNCMMAKMDLIAK